MKTVNHSSNGSFDREMEQTMKHNKKKAAALFMAAILGTVMTAGAQGSEIAETPDVSQTPSAAPSAAPESDSAAVDPGLFNQLLGEYEFWNLDETEVPSGTYTNPYFGFQYSTKSGFIEEDTLHYLIQMNDSNTDEAPNMGELRALLGARLGQGESVCIMYAQSPESEGNFPKINISVAADDNNLTSDDIHSIIASSNAELNRSICEEFDVSADQVTISYDRPELDPFDGLDAFYMNIRINEGTASGNQDTPPAEPETEEAGNTDDENAQSFYSTQIYLFGSDADSGTVPHYLCCITITASNPEDVSAVLGNLSIPESAATDSAEPAPSPAQAQAVSGSSALSPADAGSDTSAEETGELLEASAGSSSGPSSKDALSENTNPIQSADEGVVLSISSDNKNP